MKETEEGGKLVLKVIDAFDHPYRGRILRLRTVGGAPPSIQNLEGARLRAVSPTGEERAVQVLGFPLFGGKPSDERIRRTGYVDLVVLEEGEGPSTSLTWELHPHGS